MQTLLKPLLCHKQTVFQCESATQHGVKYSTESAVVTGMESDNSQKSVHIACYVLGGQLYLLCKNYKVLHYYRHYHANVVEATETYIMTSRGNSLIHIHSLFTHCRDKLSLFCIILLTWTRHTYSSPEDTHNCTPHEKHSIEPHMFCFFYSKYYKSRIHLLFYFFLLM